MIHPTRTNLLMLKDRSRSVVNSVGILKARKQALIKEFLAATVPFLRSREDIRTSYGKGSDLKDRSRSVVNSVGILKARKQALIKEFLAATVPFLRSREDIRTSYGKGLRELILATGHEGRDAVASIAAATGRDFRIDVIEKSIWGLRYKDIVFHDAP